jgi:hypothetical protein
MRMWMVDPTLLCNKHLLGEHVELHMMIGTLKKGKSIAGYLAKRITEPDQIIARHDVLVAEMKRRNMKHQSDILEEDQQMLHEYCRLHPTKERVDINTSLSDLHNRCEDCRLNILDWAIITAVTNKHKTLNQHTELVQ